MQHNTIDVLYSKSAHALVFVSPTGFRLLPLNDYDVPQTDHMSEFVPFEAGVSAHRAVIHPAVRFHYVLTMKRVDPVHSVQWQ